MAKASKITCCSLLVVLMACSTKYNEVIPMTEIVITVLDKSGAPVPGASAMVTSSKSVYDNYVAQDGSQAVSSNLSDAAGKITLPDVPFDSILYVYAWVKNTDLFPGNFIIVDNTADTYLLKNQLTRGSITYVTVTVAPADGFITFWTDVSNDNSLPIGLYLNAEQKGTLTISDVSAPAASTISSSSVRVRAGNVTVEGKSSVGCLWSALVKVPAATNIVYQFADCDAGTISFFTDGSNSTKLPIHITLNADDQISDLTSSSATVPGDCSAANLATAFRIPGNYTYKAVSSSGSCVWTGTFTVGPNSCNLISLDPCN